MTTCLYLFLSVFKNGERVFSIARLVFPYRWYLNLLFPVEERVGATPERPQPIIDWPQPRTLVPRPGARASCQSDAFTKAAPSTNSGSSGQQSFYQHRHLMTTPTKTSCALCLQRFLHWQRPSNRQRSLPPRPTPSWTFLPPRSVVPRRTLDPKEREITTGTLVPSLSPSPPNQQSRIPTVILPGRSTFCVNMEAWFNNVILIILP